MKHRINLHSGALVFAAAILIASCTAPHITLAPEPVPGAPAAELSGLKDEHKGVLGELGLEKTYRKNPDEAIRELHAAWKASGDARQLVTLVALCETLGDDRRKSNAPSAAGCYLDAAKLSRKAALRNGSAGTDMQLRLLYNEACGSLAELLFDHKDQWGGSAQFTGPLGTHRLGWRTPGTGGVDPSFFDDLVIANRMKFEDIEMKRELQDGFGAAMVGHHPKPANNSEVFISESGYVLPINASVSFGSSGAAKLELRNLLDVDDLREAGTKLPLSADWTASIAYLYRYAPKKSVGFRGMLDPNKYDTTAGLHRTQPFNPNKIPVILVHGLMSTPETWLVALNELRSDPVLRENYQEVVYRYPTGYPILENAADLRDQLAAFRKTYDSRGNHRKMKEMVIVCHSMGGNLTDLQIRDIGDGFEKVLFEVPIDDLQVDEKTKQTFRRLVRFKANPDVSRVICIASPHRGSSFAETWIGSLGNKLIRLPGTILDDGISDVKNLEITGLTNTGKEQMNSKLDSVRSLRPDNPLFPVVMGTPVQRRVTFHSIIGQINTDEPKEKGNDTFVEYWSSHVDFSVSEKIVDSKHTTITKDEGAIAEVSRILHLHLKGR